MSAQASPPSDTEWLPQLCLQNEANLTLPEGRRLTYLMWTQNPFQFQDLEFWGAGVPTAVLASPQAERFQLTLVSSPVSRVPLGAEPWEHRTQPLLCIFSLFRPQKPRDQGFRTWNPYQDSWIPPSPLTTCPPFLRKPPLIILFQNVPEWPSSKQLQTITAGKGAEKREPFCTVDGNVNWDSYYGNFLKN